jgi:Ferritin-like domain
VARPGRLATTEAPTGPKGHVFVETPATTPPGEPTGADTELLAALQGLELAARDLYQAALDAGASDDGGVLETLRANHEGYANVISGLIGGAAPQTRDEALFEQFQADFDTSDVEAVATAGYDFESSAVATHLDALGGLEGTDGAKTVASIVIVESRHCAVLADLGGQGDDLDALLVNDATPFELAGSTS